MQIAIQMIWDLPWIKDLKSTTSYIKLCRLREVAALLASGWWKRANNLGGRKMMKMCCLLLGSSNSKKKKYFLGAQIIK